MYTNMYIIYTIITICIKPGSMKLKRSMSSPPGPPVGLDPCTPQAHAPRDGR